MSVFQGPADELQTLIEGLTLTPTLAAYRWIPREFDKIPCAVIEMPDGSRTNIEEAELQYGSYTYNLTYKVSLIVDLDNPKEAQEYLVAAVEAFIAAVDTDYTLNGECEEAKVTSWETVFEQTNESRPLLAVVCNVEVLRLEQM